MGGSYLTFNRQELLIKCYKLIIMNKLVPSILQTLLNRSSLHVSKASVPTSRIGASRSVRTLILDPAPHEFPQRPGKLPYGLIMAPFAIIGFTMVGFITGKGIANVIEKRRHAKGLARMRD